MLVNNPCINDSRVIKEAEALVASGRQVAVVCRWCEGVPRHEEIRGVEYYRVNPIPKTAKHMSSMILSVVGLAKPFRPSGQAALDRPPSTRRWIGLGLLGLRIMSLWVGIRKSSWQAIKEAGSRLAPAGVGARIRKQLGRHAGIRTLLRIGAAINPANQPVVAGSLSLARAPRRLLRNLARSTALRLYWLVEFEDFGLAAARLAGWLHPDVVHAHDLAALPVGGRVARKCGACLVYDSHELEMHRNAVFPWYVWKRRRLLERRYIQKADAVITVSDSIADHLSAVYPIRRPVVIVNAPNLPAQNAEKANLRQVLGLQEQALAVYIGSVTINRGIEQCVQALALVQQLHLALVGPRRAISEQEIVQLAEDLGVRERMYLVDPVPPESVVNFVAGADVSVVPIQDVCLSYRFCLPNKLFESAFAGIPIAASDLPELRRFIERYGCGLLMDQSDPKDIAAKIESLLCDPGQFRIGPAERETLIRAYGWPAQARKLCRLYDEFSIPSRASPISQGATPE